MSKFHLKQHIQVSLWLPTAIQKISINHLQNTEVQMQYKCETAACYTGLKMLVRMRRTLQILS